MARYPKPKKFKPKNLHKYKGNPYEIIYRSSWEFKFMMWLDRNNDVLEWSSEEMAVQYRMPKEEKIRNYFPDFIMKIKDKEGKVQIYMIEIKPHKQTVPPTKEGKKEKTYLEESKTYAINKQKWLSAEEFCRKRNWHFKIMTEQNLGIK